MKPVLIILLMFAGVIAAVNVLWLQWSSAKIVVGHRGVPNVALQVEDEMINIGNLRTGESRFLFLPKTGKAKSIFEVSFMIDEVQTQVCTLEIESTKQHVEIVLYNDDVSTCSVSSPILSELIVSKFF